MQSYPPLSSWNSMKRQEDVGSSSGRYESNTLSDFVKISKAGNGTFGDVYFCLPATDLPSARAGNPPEQKITKHLLSKLVVVKVDAPLTRDWDYPLYQEVAVLKSIQKQAENHSAEHHFFRLLQWDMTGRNTEWMVTSTSPLCCNLGELRVRFDSMPEDFLWLSYVQLHDALTFLHQTCNPPIVHSDLHKKNVMITLNPENLGLPEFKIIDFGSSSFVETGRMTANSVADPFKKDIDAILLILDNIFHDNASQSWDEKKCKSFAKTHSPKNRSLNFYSFHNALIKGLDDFHGDKTVVQRKLWEHFGAYAVQRVAAISEMSKREIQDNVLFVTRPRYEANKKQVEEILAGLE